MGCCQICTICKAGETTTPCGLDRDTICTSNNGTNCLPPDHCLMVDCWMSDNGTEVQCKACEDGYYVDSQLRCTKCQSCQEGEWISYPCSGYTNTVCSTCTPCLTGQTTIKPCPGNGTTDSTQCMTLMADCPPPENCKLVSCWPSATSVEIQCTECNSGYYVNSLARCSKCRVCNQGEFISFPCSGYTNTVCSACTPCDPGKFLVKACSGNGTADATQCSGNNNGTGCPAGFRQEQDGSCTPLNCLLCGCGASHIGIECQEFNSTSISCICPDGTTTIVTPPDVFAGCSNTTQPTDQEVVAAINATQLEAFLLHGIVEITGVFMVQANGRTFTLNITSAVPATQLESTLRTQIAAFLGGSYTADDVKLTYTSRKRADNQAQVNVTLQSQVSSAGVVGYSLVLFGLLLVALQF